MAEGNNSIATYSKIILDLLSTIRKASFYPAGHPAVANAIKSLHTAFSTVLSAKNSLTVSITQEDKVLIDGQAFEDSHAFKSGLEYFREANIENLTFNAGISEQELGGLIKILLLDAAEIRAAGGIEKLMQDNNIQHIQINQFSYVKIKKGEEILRGENNESPQEVLKAKISRLSAGGVSGQKDLEAIETEMIGLLAEEFAKKKQAGSATKNLLKKFLSLDPQGKGTWDKLTGFLLEQGFPGEEVSHFIDGLKDEISAKKAVRPRRGDAKGLEELTKANEELNTAVGQLKGELAAKAAVLEALEKQNKAIMDEKERIDNIVHSMTDGMVVVDPQGKILMVNPSAEAILGISRQDIGKPIKDLVKDEHLLSLVKNKSEGQEVSDKDIELFSPNESTLKVLRASSAVVEDNNGKTVGMVAILNDITKQKEVERLKSDFLAQVSHELRTPLFALEKSLSLILDKTTGPLSGDQQKFLDMAGRNLKRLTLLINDLLDLSKLEAGKVALKREPEAVENVIEEALSMLKAWADTKTIRFEKAIQEGLPPVNIDSNRTIQVLINLISNAIKFTPSQGVITVEASREDNQEVRVCVQDTGIGIPPEELSKVFDKFYQIRSSAKTDVRGTGIGLTISKEIVELHGGRIWIESKVGEGTKFIFTLPLFKADQQVQL